MTGVLAYAQVIDCNMSTILIQNNKDTKLVILKKTRLGTITEYNADGCYVVHPDAAELAAYTAPDDDKRDAVRHEFRELLAAHATPGANETVLPNSVTIYGPTETADQLKDVAMEFAPEFWTDLGIAVDIPEEDWMEIPLVDDWQSKKLATSL